jgi:hypothetical protein
MPGNFGNTLAAIPMPAAFDGSMAARALVAFFAVGVAIPNALPDIASTILGRMLQARC